MELCFWLSLFSKLLRFAVVVQDDRRVAHIPINRNEVPEVSILRPGISNLRPKFGHDSKSRLMSIAEPLSGPAKRNPLLREYHRRLVSNKTVNSVRPLMFR